MERWYVARIHAGLDNLVVTQVEKQGFECYTPWLESGDPKAKGICARRRLFPGYAFVLLDLRGSKRWQCVNGTHGVVRLLPTHCEEPLPLPRGFIEELQGVVAARNAGAGVVVEDVVARYAAGDAVPLVAGIWAGHIGQCIKHTHSSLEVVLRLLGRDVPVQVRPSEAAPAPAELRPELSAVA